MVFRTLNTGAAGLRAHGEAIGVVGDNIANVNTVGFKNQRVVFKDMFLQQLGGTSGGGNGVRVGGVQQVFTQGALSSTGVSTDLALSGDGFFVVNGDVGGLSGNFYTRDGRFTVDADGNLVTSTGLEVQGYAANGDGTFATSLSTLQIPTDPLAPKASETLALSANLDSNSVVPADAWDAQDPELGSNFSTSMTVYDSLGNAHSVDVYFNKTGDNTWDYHVLASGDDLSPAQPGQNVEIGNGSMTFNSSGALDDFSETTPVTVSYAGASAGQPVTLDFGSSLASGGTGLNGITQFSATSAVTAQSQDGYPAGDLNGIVINQRGVIQGVYTNGETAAIGQVAVAKFAANDGLARTDGGLWSATTESGEPAIGEPGSGGRGLVNSGALESSNVDIAEEFVNLIEYQRAYSASARTITTADEMLQELVALKR